MIGLLALAMMQGPATFMEQADPMTDERLSVAMMTSGDAGFAIGCRGRDRSLQLIFMAGQHLIRTNWLTAARPFMFRFDNDEPVTSDWYYDGRFATQYSGPQLRRFLTRILSASRLRVRAYDYDGRAIDAEFAVEGIAPPLRQALQSCNDRRANEAVLPLIPR